MIITLATIDLATYGFMLQSFERLTGAARSLPPVVAGLDGYQTQLSALDDLDPFEIKLVGESDQELSGLRSVIRGDASWRALVLDDMPTRHYNVKGWYVREGEAYDKSDYRDVEIGFLVSPPCLLGAAVTDATSPVANPGDYRCPAVWTVVASGPFTLSCGGITGTWSGGAGTVVVNSETCRVTLGGVEAPRYWSGGYPWLLPGNNTVVCTPGFSATFNPRYA